MGRTWIHTNADLEAFKDHQAQQVADVLQQSVGDTRPLRDGPATLHTDPRRLRGIPAIGRNVSGCILGTDPEREATR